MSIQHEKFWKMYQMAKSLRLAQEKAQCKEVVKMPRSFFVKGNLGELYKKIDGQDVRIHTEHPEMF